MKKYITDDELEKIFIEHLDDIYEEAITKNTKIIYSEFLCDTKRKLKASLSPEQQKLLDFLNENIEIYEGAVLEDVFFYAYRLGMNHYDCS
ncbi:MAG: hypothetical protein IJX27_01075 [Clostridia bacterium]|nr:hypothetical protein [Clostridia bacterium]